MSNFTNCLFLPCILLQIYIQTSTNQIEQGIQLLTESACRVSEWAELNHLSLNTKKTKAIVFGTSNTITIFKELNISDIVINRRGDSISFFDSVLSLGVVLDNTLSWKQQIQHVTKKVNRFLYGLRFIKSCTS